MTQKPATQNMLREIFELSEELVGKASIKDVTIGTAESCTGGLIGAAITATAGSSAIFKGGIIAYDNQIKTGILGVDPKAIETYGAVSEITACQMAKGALEKLGTDLSVSVTGVAGPGGGTPSKPVGTVWIGLATQKQCFATHYLFRDLSRNKVRDMTCLESLKSLLSQLDNAF